MIRPSACLTLAQIVATFDENIESAELNFVVVLAAVQCIEVKNAINAEGLAVEHEPLKLSITRTQAACTACGERRPRFGGSFARANRSHQAVTPADLRCMCPIFRTKNMQLPVPNSRNACVVRCTNDSVECPISPDEPT